MKQGYETVLKEFFSNTSDEEIRYLGMRLTERLQDDLADVLEHLGRSNHRNSAIDNLLKSAESANDLYDYCDQLQKFAAQESERRRISLTRGRF